MTTDDLLRDATVNAALDDALELASSLQDNLNTVVLGTPGASRAADDSGVGPRGHLLIEMCRSRKDNARQAVAVSIGTRLGASRGTRICFLPTSRVSLSSRPPLTHGRSVPALSSRTSCSSMS